MRSEQRDSLIVSIAARVMKSSITGTVALVNCYALGYKEGNCFTTAGFSSSAEHLITLAGVERCSARWGQAFLDVNIDL